MLFLAPKPKFTDSGRFELAKWRKNGRKWKEAGKKGKPAVWDDTATLQPIGLCPALAYQPCFVASAEAGIKIVVWLGPAQQFVFVCVSVSPRQFNAVSMGGVEARQCFRHSVAAPRECTSTTLNYPIRASVPNKAEWPEWTRS